MTTLADRVKAKAKAKTKATLGTTSNAKKKTKPVEREIATPVKKKSAKVKSYNVSADGPPWEVSKLTKEADDLGVRSWGASEDPEDTYNEEQQAKYEKGIRRLAKRVTDKNRPYNSPATQEQATRLLLASILRQLPVAEKQYTSTKQERAAYAYNAYANQVRELMNDLRSMSSTDMLADHVITDAVNPAFMQLINHIIEQHSAMRTKLSSSGDVHSMRRSINEQLNRMLSDLGEYAQASLDKAKDATRKSLKG